ncbi:SPOR domain-containing protein [Accumulibacter sp.]|uniref:SPOR domain-containing protein n=1 Tax=Accumulibacter sp. TaxID=2053492 RepID=UPI0025F025CA|nr:SPOR domain-containing protein [Accumulibacter sp.]MCM8595462.1 SPOR domain-containing protein [Accumulibacter sp.]MDS4049609.1 SPOR domain-containing protein [Accumulibacter sp.]
MSELRRRLLGRMAAAGVLASALLVVVLLVEDPGSGQEPVVAREFTEPVPVRKKEPASGPVESAVADAASTGAASAPQAVPAVSDARPAVAESSAATAAQPATAVPRPLSGHTLQSGVVGDARRAQELQASLASEGIPSNVEALLQIGPFRTRAEADEVRRKLKAQGIETTVQKLRPAQP